MTDYSITEHFPICLGLIQASTKYRQINTEHISKKFRKLHLTQDITEEQTNFLTSFELTIKLFAEYEDSELIIKLINEHYMGWFDSKRDFAIEYFNEIHLNHNDYISGYIDYEKFERDIFTNDISAVETFGKTHVFSMCY